MRKLGICADALDSWGSKCYCPDGEEILDLMLKKPNNCSWHAPGHQCEKHNGHFGHSLEVESRS